MAADTQTKEPEIKDAGGKSVRPLAVDLHNPTPGRRVISTGLATGERHLTLESGETRRNVNIAEWVAKELRARTRGRGNESADLLVYKAGEAPDPQKDGDEDDDGDAE